MLLSITCSLELILQSRNVSPPRPEALPVPSPTGEIYAPPAEKSWRVRRCMNFHAIRGALEDSEESLVTRSFVCASSEPPVAGESIPASSQTAYINPVKRFILNHKDKMGSLNTEEELIKIIPFYKTPVNYFDFPQNVKFCVHRTCFGFFFSIPSNFFHNYFTPGEPVFRERGEQQTCINMPPH